MMAKGSWTRQARARWNRLGPRKRHNTLVLAEAGGPGRPPFKRSGPLHDAYRAAVGHRQAWRGWRWDDLPGRVRRKVIDWWRYMGYIKATAPDPDRCRCREPKTHRHCAYCGCGGDGIAVCGVCSEEGIDGPVIRGTSRVTCALHRKGA